MCVHGGLTSWPHHCKEGQVRTLDRTLYSRGGGGEVLRALETLHRKPRHNLMWDHQYCKRVANVTMIADMLKTCWRNYIRRLQTCCRIHSYCRHVTDVLKRFCVSICVNMFAIHILQTYWTPWQSFTLCSIHRPTFSQSPQIPTSAIRVQMPWKVVSIRLDTSLDDTKCGWSSLTPFECPC